MDLGEAAPASTSSLVPLAVSSRIASAAIFALFVVHSLLRLGGLGWNIQHHTAFARPGETVPTYHVDEEMLVESMRTDFRPFNAYSLVADGPLSANLVYLPSAALGERPPLRWEPARVLLTGRVVAGLSACLAFVILELLLAHLGVAVGLRVFALAVLTFAPNEVFNAHFARSHMLANLLQLIVLLATARSLAPQTRRARCGWFAAAVLTAVMAGSARYPFLTLGLFPAAAALVLLARAAVSGELFAEAAALGLAGAVGLGLGLVLGFDLRPIEMLRKGLVAQAAVGQYAWSDVRGIARSAGEKLLSVFDFPGGAARLVLAVASPFAILRSGPTGRPDASRLICGLLMVWTALYVLLWAKFGVPWQRYSIPVGTAFLVMGTVGLDRVASIAGARFRSGRLRIAGSIVAALLLASPGYLCALMLRHFVADAANPLYELSIALREEPRRQIFMNAFWQWNSPLLDVMPPDRFAVRFVPSMREACALANEGDLVVNLVFEPLRGSCDRHRLTAIFHASNLGPPGFPYSRDHDSAPWARRHYEDYHYLFEEVTVSRFTEEASGR